MDIRKKTKEYVLVSILLFFSGNPLAGVFGKYEMLVGLFLILFLLKDNIKEQRLFFLTYRKILVFLTIIFIFQWQVLGFVSWFGVFNFYIKVFIGGGIIYHLKDSFGFILFQILFYLSLVSILFFTLINIAKFPLPGINLNEYNTSYIIYGIGFHPLQNQGMFWEPGAFAGIITLCLALNFKDVRLYLGRYRFRVITIIVALITTQSTTGYIAIFIIAVFYMATIKNKFILVFLAILFSSGIVYIYQNVDFLQTKIIQQYEDARSQNIGEFSNTRFGSFIFDWYYIKKHPLIGNGIHEKTRYADHEYLFTGAQGKDTIGSGNGFSNYLASMGVLFIIGYFFLLYRAFLKNGKLFDMLVLLVVLINLQGEQWFGFPLYLGLVFANLKNVKNISGYTNQSNNLIDV